VIRRREFIAGLGATAWPVVALAQQADRMRRIGVLMNLSENDPEGRLRVVSFQQGLEKLGWTLGRNLRIEYRWAAGDIERIRIAVPELIGLAPDAVLAHGTPALRAMRQATTSIPIVFTVVSEPVAAGFVVSLAHPGGNITGFANLEPSIGAKWLGFTGSHARRVGVQSRHDPGFPTTIPLGAGRRREASGSDGGGPGAQSCGNRGRRDDGRA
jgi:putative ABC transport system substrate-binding protein